jgi:hypothetical protein
MIDELDLKEETERKTRYLRFVKISHIHEIISIIYSILCTLLLSLLVAMAGYKMIYHGLYHCLTEIVKILNSLEWTSIIMILFLIALNIIHSISIRFLKNKDVTK